MNLADLLVRLDQIRADEAAGFVVLVIDDEDNRPISVYGPCPTPEAALVLAGDFDRDEHSGTNPADGSPGWRHVVLPLFEAPQ